MIITLQKYLFKKKVLKFPIGLIHNVYLKQCANTKLNLSSTKTKAEVRGGGKKPWKQKGTGRARAGSSRSPLWVGGGIIFGPKYRILFKKINKKEKRLTIIYILYIKKIILIQEKLFLNFINYSFNYFLQFLKILEFDKIKKITFILSEPKILYIKFFKNLKSITFQDITSLNIVKLLTANKIIFSDLALKNFNKIYFNTEKI